MSTARAVPSSEKELLLARSGLCRLQLRRQAQDLRDGLPWNRAAHALANAPAFSRLAFGVVLSVAGPGRTSRMLMLAGRIVLIAKLARSLIGSARQLAGSPRSLRPNARGVHPPG